MDFMGAGPLPARDHAVSIKDGPGMDSRIGDTWNKTILNRP